MLPASMARFFSRLVPGRSSLPPSTPALKPPPPRSFRSWSSVHSSPTGLSWRCFRRRMASGQPTGKRQPKSGAQACSKGSDATEDSRLMRCSSTHALRRKIAPRGTETRAGCDLSSRVGAGVGVGRSQDGLGGTGTAHVLHSCHKITPRQTKKKKEADVCLPKTSHTITNKQKSSLCALSAWPSLPPEREGSDPARRHDKHGPRRRQVGQAAAKAGRCEARGGEHGQRWPVAAVPVVGGSVVCAACAGEMGAGGNTRDKSRRATSAKFNYQIENCIDVTIF